MTLPTWSLSPLRDLPSSRVLQTGPWLALLGPDVGGIDDLLSAPEDDQWVDGWLAACGGAAALARLEDGAARVWATSGVAVGTGPPDRVSWLARSQEPVGTWILTEDDVVLALVDPRVGVPADPPDGFRLVRPLHRDSPGQDAPLRPGAVVHDPARRRRAPLQVPPEDLGGFSLLDLGDPVALRPVPSTHVPSEASSTPDLKGAVDGKRCRVGHFNHPLAVYCHRCGRGFAATGTHVPDRAPRPPLGVLVDASGIPHPVDRRIIVGRTPTEDDDVVAGRSLAVRVTDPAVSRVHLELHADGWELMAIDRSANGSRCWNGARWLDLPHGEPCRVAPGSTLQVGAAHFRYLSHHVANNVAEPDA